MTRRKTIVRSQMPRPQRAERLQSARHGTLAAATGRAARKSTALKPVATKSAPAASQGKLSRDDLQRQLNVAEANVKALEARLAAVTDRIAWIADRLHSLLEERE